MKTAREKMKMINMYIKTVLSEVRRKIEVRRQKQICTAKPSGWVFVKGFNVPYLAVIIKLGSTYSAYAKL